MYPIHISINITDFKGDAIVNSLGFGEGAFVFGKICSSILNATQHKYDDDIVDRAIHLDIGEAFVTKTEGEVPFKYISNVIAPFRWKEYVDKGELCDNLVEAYRNAFIEAYKNGARSICVPLIGASKANGYSKGESYDALLEAATTLEDCAEEEGEFSDLTIYVDFFYLENGFSSSEINRIRQFRKEAIAKYAKKYGIDFEQVINVKSWKNHKYLLVDNQYLFEACLCVDKCCLYVEPYSFEKFEKTIVKGDTLWDVFEKYFAATGIVSNKVKNQNWALIGSVLNVKEGSENYSQFLNALKKENKYDVMNWTEKTNPIFKWKKHKLSGAKFKGKNVYGWTKPCKTELILSCCAVKMDRKTIDWMINFCQFSLSKFNEVDEALYEALENYEKKNRSVADFISDFKSLTSTSIYSCAKVGEEIPMKVTAYSK